jgi:hypothetical protein
MMRANGNDPSKIHRRVRAARGQSLTPEGAFNRHGGFAALGAALAGPWPMAINRRQQPFPGGKRPHLRKPMKPVLTVLGVVLLVIAAVYFLVPADQLPGLLPGHEAGVAKVHVKHGIASGVVGLVLIGAGTFLGRR